MATFSLMRVPKRYFLPTSHDQSDLDRNTTVFRLYRIEIVHQLVAPELGVVPGAEPSGEVISITSGNLAFIPMHPFQCTQLAAVKINDSQPVATIMKQTESLAATLLLAALHLAGTGSLSLQLSKGTAIIIDHSDSVAPVVKRAETFGFSHPLALCYFATFHFTLPLFLELVRY
jgi:hypothetical protein